MSGIFHEGRWYENTDMICRRCGTVLYQCVAEQLHRFPAVKQKLRVAPQNKNKALGVKWHGKKTTVR